MVSVGPGRGGRTPDTVRARARRQPTWRAASDVRPAERPGQGEEAMLVGRYALGPVIGRGSSAVVRRAVDMRTGEPVAVKMFTAAASALDEQRQRRELAALAAVDHPGLVRLRAGGMTDDRPFVVMDLVDGPTLAQRLSRGPLPAAEVARLGGHLADALAHMHASGFVHRDVKPANVLLGDGSRPRLADFGIARALDDTSVTATGFVVGTAAFLAPEQVRGEDVDQRADVYALGLVLLEALLARREYPGSAVESATARLHRSPRVPDSPVGRVIAAMTMSDPAARLDAARAAAALGALADTTCDLPTGTAPPAPVSRVVSATGGGSGGRDAAGGGRAPGAGTALWWVRRLALPVAAVAVFGSGLVSLVPDRAAGPAAAPTAAPPVPSAPAQPVPEAGPGPLEPPAWSADVAVAATLPRTDAPAGGGPRSAPPATTAPAAAPPRPPSAGTGGAAVREEPVDAPDGPSASGSGTGGSTSTPQQEEETPGLLGFTSRLLDVLVGVGGDAPGAEDGAPADR